MGRTVAQKSHRHERWIIVGAAGLVVVVTGVLPLIEIAAQAVDASAKSSSILQSSRPWFLLLRSIGLAVTVTAGTLLLGVPLGVAFGRARIPAPRLLFTLHALPMFLPPFFSALGWFHLVGGQGLLGSQLGVDVLFSASGLVIVMTLALAPVVTALTALGVASVDQSLEESARVVASPVRVMTRILLPAAWPAILLAALIVFTLVFSELAVPMFLRVDVYPASVFARLGAIDFAPGEAAALVLPMIPVALSLAFIERRVLSRRAFTVLGVRGPRRERLPIGRWASFVFGCCLLAAALSLLPLVGLLWRALRGRGFDQVSTWIGSSASNSLWIAAVAASVITGVSVVLGHALARQSSVARLIDGAALLAFFVPSAVLGVGIIAVWNRPATAFVYGSLTIVVIGYAARYAVVGIRSFASAVSQSSASYEEAARAAGAGYARRLVGIVVPMHWRAVVATWLIVLVFCLRDVETSVLFYPPGGDPLTVRIFTLEANGPPATVAALALIQVGISVAALVVGAALLGRKPR